MLDQTRISGVNYLLVADSMEEAGFKDIVVVQDYGHLDRVVWGRLD